MRAMGDGDLLGCWFFRETERKVLAECLRAIAARDPAGAGAMQADLGQLSRVAETFRGCTPVADHGPEGQPAAEYLANLGPAHEYTFDLYVPTRAVLGQAYLNAKTHFLRSVVGAIRPQDVNEAYLEGLRSAFASAVHAKMIEELFVAVLTDRKTDRDVQIGAAERLVRIWNDNTGGGVDDVAFTLQAAWEARLRVRPVLGTMLGTQEIFQLFQEAPDERFLNYFGSGAAGEEEIAAFEEFVFGLSYEEIGSLRQTASGGGVVSREDAHEELSATTGLFVFEGEGPEALYASFRRRRVKARYRRLTKVPGPRKAAEEYVACALLSQEAAG